MRLLTDEERIALKTIGPPGEGPVADATFAELERLGYGAWVDGFWEVTPAGARALELDTVARRA